MLHGVHSLMDKIRYRLWKIYFSLYSRGVIFERTMFWNKQLLKLASVIIENEKIENVIISIPPFRLATYALKLKEKFRGVNFIVDYRDPWTDNKSFHGFKDISDSRFIYEKELEGRVLCKADKIISVSEKMTEGLMARNLHQGEIITIPNGYDPDDIQVGKENLVKSEKIKIVYAGTLYSDLEYVVLPFITYLDKLKQTNKTLHDRFSFEFYGNLNKELKDKLKLANDGSISVFGSVSLNEMQEKLSNCSCCMLITPPDYSVVFNTKFFEYLANRKPVLLFTYPCDASEFLVKNKLGFHINPDSLEKDMDTFFTTIDNVISGFNKDFDISRFSLPYLTSELEKMFK